MTIELSGSVQAQLQESARAEGISVDRYIQALVEEKNMRRLQIAAFRAAIAERLTSLDAGVGVDGEEVMDRLIAELDTNRQVR